MVNSARAETVTSECRPPVILGKEASGGAGSRFQHQPGRGRRKIKEPDQAEEQTWVYDIRAGR